MLYRLALDIGTASCGLIAVRLGENFEPDDIVFRALHIFSEPVLPAKSGGVGEPKKAARRKARMARRVIDRRVRRLKRIAMLAGLLGLDQHNIGADKGQGIHRVRALAATECIDLDDLIRVLLKLAKRRGYAGGFKTKKEGDEGVVEPGIHQLKAAMDAAACKTIGQYLQHRFDKGETLKLKEAGLYGHRDMLIEEFNAIWSEQARHHPILNESRPDPVLGGERSIREQFFNAIFYQRPLKSVAPMVGNCSLEPSLPRAPMAQPAMQAFRIEKQLADLRWGMGRKAEPLSTAQKAIIREMLNDPAEISKKDGKLTFKKIYAALDKKNLMPAGRRSLNMERSSREDLTGNRTLRAMRDLGVIDQWQTLDSITQLRIINFLADLGSPEQVDQPNWHERFTKTKRVKNPKSGRWEQPKRTLDPKLVEFVNSLVNSGTFDRLSKMGLESGRASYSIRALEKLTALMRSADCDERAAIQRCYPPPEKTGELLMHLPQHKPTGNVVVDVALGVVRKAVNEVLAALGEPPAEVVVELSRDMALGLKARGEIESKIDKNRRRKENARKELHAHGKLPTERNVLRYLLWEQQDKKHCPYCPEIISLEQALDGNTTNFEHILPRSLTRVGKQRNHLVLAHRSCNDAKGDRTPFEAFGHVEERWSAVKYCASVLVGNKQFAKARLLTLAEYEHEILDDSSITEFTERQFAETSWIGKLTAQWLQAVCPAPVAVSRGTLTAHLRRIWKLETVIAQARFDAGLPVLDQEGEKISLDDFKRYKAFWEGHYGKEHERTDRKIDKRIDHRHHLIDALVIAQTSRSLYQRMAKHYKELAERRQAGEPVRMKLFVEPPLVNVRERALELVRDAEIRHKPDRQSDGMFFQQTAYRKVWTEDNKSRLAIRVVLSQLTDAKGSLDKARKGISDIASDHTRRVVSEEFERRITSGKSVKEALATPIMDPQFRTQIKRVAVYQRVGRGFIDGSSAFRIEHGSRNPTLEKHYVSDGYAYISLIHAEGKLLSAESVSVFAANRRNKQPRAGERRFFRGDTLQDANTGKKYVIHQLLANATVRVAEMTEARSWIELGSESGATQFGARALTSLTSL